ncbi:hypothetical protein DdX_10159 [Ditylenchus destructor]|uniref:Uncharacterized protein n=1 Tax=Ditylenchus destructor TaxID=166010 RepID=A0AAD4N1C0_9BILA|nr:hypothetical protein DdX_10159 [Ditylenchus destructor]
MFRTGKALEYYDVISNKSNIIETQINPDRPGDSAKVYWHDIKMHVNEVKKGEHFITTKIIGRGRDTCCSMQAKVMAPEITKCYFAWKKLNSPDVPQEVCVPRLRPERISYKIQFTDTAYNTTETRSLKFGERIQGFDNRSAAANLKESIKAVYDQQIADDLPSLIGPDPRGIPEPDYDPDYAPEPETKEHPLDETERALNYGDTTIFNNTMYPKNILCNPFVKPTTQLRQLYHVCWGVEAATGIIDVFSNDPDAFDYVKPIEDELGYLDLDDPRTQCPK